jgi:DnaJ-class molecular chaperone
LERREKPGYVRFLITPLDECGAMLDPYQTLGISRRASQAEIKQNYRRLAKELHPDRQPNNASAAEKFKEIAAAYHVLGDARQRSRFDRGEIDAQGHARAGYQPPPKPKSKPQAKPQARKNASAAGTTGAAGGGASAKAGAAGAAGAAKAKAQSRPQPTAPEAEATVEDSGFNNFGFGAFSASDIFQPFFRKDKKAPPPKETRSPLDRRYKLEIGLLDAIKGGKKRLSLATGKDVFVTVPPGVEDGQMIRLKGMGDKGKGSSVGDALVEISIKHHPYFVRVGADIHVELPVTVQEAVLGTRLEVPTIDGPVSVTVPKGANTGIRLRLKGKGIVDAKSGTRGDQHLLIKVVLPDGEAGFEKLVKQWAPGNDYDVRENFRKLQE